MWSRTTREPLAGCVALVIVTEAVASVGSAVVWTVLPVALPLVGLVRPATRSVVAMLGATAHVPPLLASVTVSTRPVAPADPTEQFVNLFSSVTTGEAGTVKPPLLALNVTTTWLPAASAPPLVGVKPTTHDASAPDDCGVPTKLSAVGVDDAIVTLRRRRWANVSLEVATEKFAAAYGDPALEGLVIPAMVTVPVVLAASAHVPASVIVIVWPDFEPVLAVQVPVNPLVKVTAGWWQPEGGVEGDRDRGA